MGNKIIQKTIVITLIKAKNDRCKNKQIGKKYNSVRLQRRKTGL